MQWSDLAIASKYIDYAEVASWAQTRQIMLCSAMPWLKNKNTRADEIWPLPIDETWQKKEELTTEIDSKDVAWYKNFKEKYNKNKEGK